jgi:hypothetical protein
MSIDTGNRSPMGRFILQIFAAVAETERAFIVERTALGFNAYRGELHDGQARDPHGFTVSVSASHTVHSAVRGPWPRFWPANVRKASGGSPTVTAAEAAPGRAGAAQSA